MCEEEHATGYRKEPMHLKWDSGLGKSEPRQHDVLKYRL